MSWISGQVVTVPEPRERRGKARSRVLLEAEPPPGIDGFVRVLDLSASGMMFHCDHPFEPEETVEIGLPGVGPVEARVVWTRQGLVGCEFLRPLSRRTRAILLLRALKPRQSAS